MNATLFTELLEKEMTRKEFLLHVGLLFLAITGITGLIKTLSNPHVGRNHAKLKADFGAGPYGV